MFCHSCGRKLAADARFCSWCGTAVPADILAEMNAPALVPAPVAELVPEPAPAPAPEPVLESKPALVPEPAPAPKPEPKRATKSKSKPKPTPKPEPAPAPQPEPKPEPAPAPKPEPTPVEAVMEELPVETVVFPLTVKRDQVEREETLVLRHEALREPLQFTLRRAMKDGMRLRLTNAKLIPAASGAERKFLLELHVEAPAPQKEPPKRMEITTVSINVTADQVAAGETIRVNHSRLAKPAEVKLDPSMGKTATQKVWTADFRPEFYTDDAFPVLQVALQVIEPPAKGAAQQAAPAQSASRGTYTPPTQPVNRATHTAPSQPANRPAANATPIQAAPKGRTVSFPPVSLRTSFQFCPENQLKTGFKMGGADDEGSIEIEPAKLTVYKKSKAVGMAFGVIGSAIEGKGKYLATVRPQDIASFEKTEPGRNATCYWIRLKDGQLLKVNVIGSRTEEYKNALDRFLSQI